MKLLSAEEDALLEGLIEFWLDHANERNNAVRERDRAWACLARIAAAVSVDFDAPEGMPLLECWEKFIEVLDAHFDGTRHPKAGAHHED
jgi:hypothetical protein